MAAESAKVDMGAHQELLIKDVEGGGPIIHKPRQCKQIRIKHFPIFIIGISIIQVQVNLQQNFDSFHIVFSLCDLYVWLGDPYVYCRSKTFGYDFRN